MQAIVTGGFRSGQPSTKVLALNFDLENVNAVQNYVCNMVAYLPDLTVPRFMHQACIIKGKSNSWTLLVVGGKSQTNNWLRSVESLDLLPFFKTGLMEKAADGLSLIHI